jgi:hypothetical protein
MELNTTKQDMLERFRLYGEIYCLLAEIEEDDGTMDYFKLEGWEIEELLEEDLPLFDIGEEKGELRRIEFENEMIMVFFTEGDGMTYGWQIINYPTDTIRKLKDLLERYVKALKEEEA